MRISRAALIPTIAALGVAGTVLAAPAVAATHVPGVYVHSSQPRAIHDVYVHS